MRALHRRVRDLRARGDAGVSLIEVMVAFVLLALVASAVAAGLTRTLSAARGNESRVVAADIATQQVEQFRGLTAKSVPLGTTYATVPVDGRNYTVKRRVSLDTAGGSANACAGSTGPAAFQRIDVTVTWPNMTGVEPVHNDTIKALPISGADTGTGTLVVPVRGAGNQPIAGITVTVNPGNYTDDTDDTGCAIFPTLPPGTNYVASVSTPGYVDPNGNQAVSSSLLSVTGAAVTKAPPFLYDQARDLDVTLTASAGYALPQPVTGTTKLGLTVGSTYFSTGNRKYPVCGANPCVTGGPTVLHFANVFPTIYQLWPGTCDDASAGPALGNVPSPQSGVPWAYTMPAMSGVQATVGPAPGKPSGTFTVYAVHDTSTDCFGGARETYRFPGTYTVPSTPGTTLKLALPAGAWRLVTNLANVDKAGAYTVVHLPQDNNKTIAVPAS